MGNVSTPYEKVNNENATASHSCEIKKRVSDREAITRTLATADGKLTEPEAACLFNRCERILYKIDRHANDEPFKKFDEAFLVTTSLATSQLRIAANYDSHKYLTRVDRRKLMLFQFEEDGDVYIQCETDRRTVMYAKSEKVLADWFFTPSLHGTHHLAITVLKEEVDGKDDIYFVTDVAIKLGIVDATTTMPNK